MTYHDFENNKFPLLQLNIPDYTSPNFTTNMYTWTSKWDPVTIRKDD